MSAAGRPTVGIRAIGTYIPELRIDNVARAAEYGRDAAFVEEKLGFRRLARKAPHEETSDLCLRAYADLQRRTDLDSGVIDCLVVCTQNPDAAGLPHTAAIVHAGLGLGTTVAAFDISLGCSGYVYGLSLVSAFMEMNRLDNGLLFTADPYSKVLEAPDLNTELLFGDAATVTWLSRSGPAYRLGRGLFATDGAGQGAIRVDADQRKLHMKGRSVFNFTMKAVPEQIMACLEENGCSVPDVDYFLLHQGSRYIVDNMVANLGLPADRTPFMAGDYGNTVSSSLPLMLQAVLPERPDTVLLSGFGVGLSWATTMLFRLADNRSENEP